MADYYLDQSIVCMFWIVSEWITDLHDFTDDLCNLNKAKLTFDEADDNYVWQI